MADSVNPGTVITVSLAGGSIEERLRLTGAFSDPDVWRPFRPKRRELIAGAPLDPGPFK